MKGSFVHGRGVLRSWCCAFWSLDLYTPKHFTAFLCLNCNARSFSSFRDCFVLYMCT